MTLVTITVVMPDATLAHAHKLQELVGNMDGALVLHADKFFNDPISQLQLIYRSLGLAAARYLAMQVHQVASSNQTGDNCRQARLAEFAPRYPGTKVSACGSNKNTMKSAVLARLSRTRIER